MPSKSPRICYTILKSAYHMPLMAKIAPTQVTIKHMDERANTEKAVLFDFDGTVADSFEAFIHTAEIVLHRQPFTPDEILELKQYSMPEVMKRLDIKKRQLPRLVIKGRKEVDRHMGDITPAYPGEYLRH